MMEENVNQKDLDLKTVVLEIEEPDQEPEKKPTCCQQLMATLFCRTWRQPLAQMRDDKAVRS